MHVIYAEFAKDILSVRDNGVERNITVSSNFTRRAPQCDFTQNSLFGRGQRMYGRHRNNRMQHPGRYGVRRHPTRTGLFGYAGVSRIDSQTYPLPCITASNAASISSESHLLSTTPKGLSPRKLQCNSEPTRVSEKSIQPLHGYRSRKMQSSSTRLKSNHA